MINVLHASYEYTELDENNEIISSKKAVDDLSLTIDKGSFICILGPNGSGKSTFARLLNALYQPSGGKILVAGMDTLDEGLTLKIREAVGMVFQNPDNQIIANVVEEDVAFGPENIGVPSPEIISRVDEALRVVDMEGYRFKSPNNLSGGQKQRVAIAGIMAMRPECIIFDESTAMLDPDGRKDVLNFAHKLNREEGITIIYITHYMEETVDADRILVLSDGKVAKDSKGATLDGTPKEIFSKVEELRRFKLTVPVVTRLAFELKKAGVRLPDGILKREELLERLLPMLKKSVAESF